MKILYYCQHVLGVGHFFRSLEIARALDGCDVVMVTGGQPVETDLPAHVRRISLPALRMDPDFGGLLPGNGETDSLDRIKARRQKMLMEAFREEAPDIFLVELYPFGRGSFRFELEPVLEAVRTKDLPAARVVCSVRDILVEKKKQKAYEERVLRALSAHFDEVLVHSDPRLFRLEKTFGRAGEIPVPVRYTGFVAQRPPADAGPKLRAELGLAASDLLVVASAGGGAVGADLLSAVVRAHRIMNRADLRLRVFTGPFMDDADFDRITSEAGSGAEVARFFGPISVFSGRGRPFGQHGRVQHLHGHAGGEYPGPFAPLCPESRTGAPGRGSGPPGSGPGRG